MRDSEKTRCKMQAGVSEEEQSRGPESSSYSSDMATLEKLLPGLIVTQNQKERVLLKHIENLQSELNRRNLAFQQTLTHFQRRLQQLSSKKQEELQAVAGDSDSGIGEEHLTVHLAVILHRQNGSLGFNMTGGKSSQQGSMDLIVSRVSPTGPAKGKLCLQDKITKVNGVDICGSTHDEVIGIFKNAQDPLVVEILRQLPTPWPHFSDAFTQTELVSPTEEKQFKDTSENEEGEQNDQKRKSDDILDEDLQKYDIEYEEVTLEKLSSESKLGLTIFYAEESETDIFIGEVDPESVAGRDGRIRSGDQIIQVNGTDIRTRSQAVELFGHDSAVVSVVVARPHLKMDADLDSVPLVEDEDERSDCLGPLLSFSSHLYPQSILEEAEYDNGVVCGRIEEEEEEEEEEDEDDGGLGVEKDSGVGKTDESTRTEESSEPESIKEWAEKPTNQGLSEDEQPADIEDKKAPLQNIKKRQDSAIAMGIDASNSTMDKSEAVHQWVESTAHNSKILSERLCLGMFLPPPPSEPDSDAFSTYSCDCCSGKCFPLESLPPTSPTTTVYTDRHNLARTIRLQQKLFRRALLTSSSPTRGQTSPKSAVPPSPKSSSSLHPLPPSSALEWKVKKRSDGTRCIVRRPVRNRLLKERAHRLAEQREGMTTDDDAASEFKVGRYWSKEERKGHLERARERHKHKEEFLRARNEGKGSAALADGTKPADILELSRRKMMRVKGKSLLDDFTTVQEVLAHGSRTSGGSKLPHSLLSVTTV